MINCKEDKKFIIYMHKNKINGKIYIGQTCRSLRLRSGANGKNYATQPIFYRAIKNMDGIILNTLCFIVI